MNLKTNITRPSQLHHMEFFSFMYASYVLKNGWVYLNGIWNSNSR